MLDVQLSAIASRHRFTTDPNPVIDELRQLAGVRTDILAHMAGTWAGYYEDENTRPLATALRGINGAEQWVALGRKRRGYPNHAINVSPLGAHRDGGISSDAFRS